MKKISLRRRFLFAIIGFSVASWLLGVLLLVTVVTPEVPNSLVLLDEKARLADMALQYVESGKPPSTEALGRHITLEPVGESQTDASVLTRRLVPGTQEVLVSRRPLGLVEAGRVFGFDPYRRIAATLTTLLLMYILASRLESFVSRPLTQFRLAVERIADGERHVTVELPAEAELAELGEAFNRMSGLLVEREEELKQALASKELLFASTSHELRTPLTVILGYVQMLEDGLKGPLNEKQSESVQVLKRNATELLDQVENLLTYAKPGDEVQSLNLESVDLRDLVEEVTANLRPMAEAKGLTMETDLGREERLLSLDYQQGRQILSNLLGNAIKFTESGCVEVTITERGVEVSDTGPGIEAAHRDKIFEEFHRTQPSEKTSGLGLGLSLARRFSREMGGEIELAESGPSGSKFLWQPR